MQILELTTCPRLGTTSTHQRVSKSCSSVIVIEHLLACTFQVGGQQRKDPNADTPGRQEEFSYLLTK